MFNYVYLFQEKENMVKMSTRDGMCLVDTEKYNFFDQIDQEVYVHAS